MLDATLSRELAGAFWKAQGLRTMTANALAAQGICSFDALAACDHRTVERMYSIGKKGAADIQALLLRRAVEVAGHAPSLATYSDDALVMELLRRGYRVDRPNGGTPDA
jgi:hypothetical protein